VQGAAGSILSWTDGTTPGTLYSGGGYVGLTYPAGEGGFFINVAGEFNTISTNGLERVRIDSSGNVGIGNTAPTSLLALSTGSGAGSDATSTGTLQIRQASTGLANGGGLEFHASTFGAGYGFKWSAIDNSGIHLVLGSRENSATWTERLRITSAGNVGIGVTPSAWASTYKVLQIGQSGALATDTGSTSVVRLYANTYYDGTNLRYLNTNFASQYLQYNGEHSWFIAPSGTAGDVYSHVRVMILNTSGNLGVGTASPAYRLDVQTSSEYQISWTRTSSSKTWAFGSDSLGTYFANRTDSVLPMYITNAGNIGIGTTSPSYKLDVAGNIKTSGLLLEKFVSFTPTTTGWYRIINVGPSGGGLVRVSASYDNAVTDVEFQFNIGGYGTDGSIQQTRYASYNGGVIDKARISSDGSGSCYLDIYVFTAASPAAISLYFYGPQMPSPVASPVVGATAGSTNVRTLTLGHGFRTTNGSNFAEVSGNVGIGTSSPTTKLHVDQLTDSNGITLALNARGASRINWDLSGTNNEATSFYHNNGTNRYLMQQWSRDYVSFCSSNTERARITSGGSLLVGRSDLSVDVVGIRFDGDGGSYNSIPTGSGTLYVRNTTDTAYRFYVSASGTVFAANTTISSISDRRVKENIVDLDVGLDAIMALKPRKFDWKTGKGKGTKNDRGFIAQEFETVFPDLIDTWKDEAPEGEEPYKSLRADLIPVIVKALQELKEDNDSLRARLAALELN
jgi:hypothetical protein